MIWTTSILVTADKRTRYKHYDYIHRYFLTGTVLRAHTHRILSKQLPMIFTKYNALDEIDKKSLFIKEITIRIPKRATFFI